MYTSNGWYLDVPPAGTGARLVLFFANNTFTLSVLCALKELNIPQIIAQSLIPFVFL